MDEWYEVGEWVTLEDRPTQFWNPLVNRVRDTVTTRKFPTCRQALYEMVQCRRPGDPDLAVRRMKIESVRAREVSDVVE